MKRLLALLSLILPASLFAATHNVTGSWSNIPWSSVNAGDIVYVSNISSGSLSLSKNGTSGNLIWIVCRDGTATSGALSLSGRSYIGIVGIRFTGTISLSNTTGCQIIDCVRTGGSSGVSFSVSSGSNNNLIRGMELSNLSPEGNIFSISGDNNVVEYCKSTTGGDFARIFGNYNVVRNNYMGPRTAATSNHVDDLQSYEQNAGNPNWTINNLWESNISNTNSSSDAHGFIIQDTSSSVTLRGGLIRGNVHYNLGRNVGEWNNWPDVYAYNNTFADSWDVPTSWADFTVWIRGSSSGHVWGNNSFVRCTSNNQGDPFELSDGGSGTVRFNNHSYQSGTLSGGSGNLNGSAPQFANESQLDYMPTSTSPLRNAARYLARASNSGTNSTILNVDDAKFFCDGWNMVEGDLIRIGASGSPVRISRISSNTITLVSARSWSANDGVYVVGWDTDIGALAYRSGGYSLSGSISASGSNHTVSVPDPSIVRMVVFYENGVPKAPDYDSPYQYTSQGGTVTAKIYGRFASITSHVSATTGSGGSTGVPTAPSSLSASPQ